MIAFVDRATPAGAAPMIPLVVLAATDPGVRVVIKELPLLSRQGVEAAKTALAAENQGGRAYRAFEAAMLRAGPASAATSEEAATRAGLDIPRLERDRMDPQVTARLRLVRAQADALGILATPTMLVGNHAMVGLRSIGDLRAAVATARKEK